MEDICDGIIGLILHVRRQPVCLSTLVCIVSITISAQPFHFGGSAVCKPLKGAEEAG